MSMQLTGKQFRIVVLAAFTLVAFAANSVLCRLALGNAMIDAASFATIRLVSGAITLWLLAAFLARKNSSGSRGNWASALALFTYAIAFSFAYMSLSAGTGALILFGAVQATMILTGLHNGERPHLAEWAGLVVALGGLVYLVFPGLTAPSPTGAALMAAAGVAWGVYSLRGRGATDPILVTTDNFVRTVPLVLMVSLIMLPGVHLSPVGVLLAVSSGSLASGLGYVLWYAALPSLTATRAATLQLTVPVLAALGGVVFLGEVISLRLIVSGVMILGGVGLAVAGHEHFVRGKAKRLREEQA